MNHQCSRRVSHFHTIAPGLVLWVIKKIQDSFCCARRMARGLRLWVWLLRHTPLPRQQGYHRTNPPKNSPTCSTTLNGSHHSPNLLFNTVKILLFLRQNYDYVCGKPVERGVCVFTHKPSLRLVFRAFFGVLSILKRPWPLNLLNRPICIAYRLVKKRLTSFLKRGVFYLQSFFAFCVRFLLKKK